MQPRYTTYFGEEVGADLIQMQLLDGTPICGLNLVDRHTGFQVCWPPCSGTYRKQPNYTDAAPLNAS